jgi:hypothetical protein
MSSERSPDPRIVRRLIGVYNADGTVLGELRYFARARFGRAHCALCDVTHGLVRAKRDWQAWSDGLPVSSDMYHRDDQPDALRRCYDTPPIVAAKTDLGYVVLLGPEELAECRGSAERLAAATERALARAGLAWPR